MGEHSVATGPLPVARSHRENALKPLILAGLAFAAAACQSVPPEQRTATPAQGLLIAQNSCSDCHQVRRTGSSPNPDAPTFASIVSRDGLTPDTLSGWLHDSHNYPAEMGFQLDRYETDALVAYMMRLRSGGDEG